MTRPRTLRRALRSNAGFTIVEMAIATFIMMTITGAIFSMMHPSQGLFQTQPEVSDMQQRMRVGVDSLQKELVMAGAGVYSGAAAGALSYFMAPIMPYRSIGDDTDASKGVFFRDDAITLMYVPPTPSQTTISNEMPAQSAEIKVNPQPNCPDKKTQLCGFEVGMRLIIFDQDGNWDVFTVTEVQDAAAHLQHRGQDFTVPYSAGSNVTQVKIGSYYLQTDEQTDTYQLMYFDGWNDPAPVVDHVVKLQFEYFGEPQPPQRTTAPLASNGPWVTYGPKPIPLTESRTGWANGENCTFAVADGQHVPRLAKLADGVAQVPLTKAILTDGPWCPDASKPNRFDADLFRVRRVRVKLRVQVALASLRGPSATLFANPGTAESRFVPDQEVTFDVTPRNLNLGR
jgi:hypothetical protein